MSDIHPLPKPDRFKRTMIAWWLVWTFLMGLLVGIVVTQQPVPPEKEIFLPPPDEPDVPDSSRPPDGLPPPPPPCENPDPEPDHGKDPPCHDD